MTQFSIYVILSIQVLNFHIRKCSSDASTFGAIIFFLLLSFSLSFWLMRCATGELLFSLLFDGNKKKLREGSSHVRKKENKKEATDCRAESKWKLRYVFLCNWVCVCANVESQPARQPHKTMDTHSQLSKEREKSETKRNVH